MIVLGIWTEKGLGFVVPGFIPTPLGDFVQYVPSTNELLICAGIWAFSLLIYSVLLTRQLYRLLRVHSTELLAHSSHEYSVRLMRNTGWHRLWLSMLLLIPKSLNS